MKNATDRFDKNFGYLPAPPSADAVKASADTFHQILLDCLQKDRGKRPLRKRIRESTSYDLLFAVTRFSDDDIVRTEVHIDEGKKEDGDRVNPMIVADAINQMQDDVRQCFAEWMLWTRIVTSYRLRYQDGIEAPIEISSFAFAREKVADAPRTPTEEFLGQFNPEELKQLLEDEPELLHLYDAMQRKCTTEDTLEHSIDRSPRLPKTLPWPPTEPNAWQAERARKRLMCEIQGWYSRQAWYKDVPEAASNFLSTAHEDSLYLNIQRAMKPSPQTTADVSESANDDHGDVYMDQEEMFGDDVLFELAATIEWKKQMHFGEGITFIKSRNGIGLSPDLTISLIHLIRNRKRRAALASELVHQMLADESAYGSDLILSCPHFRALYMEIVGEEEPPQIL